MSKREILIVDDADFYRKLLGSYFEHRGYTVSYASNGREALGLIDNKLPESFEVIISDYNMPIMDGKEFINKCRTYEEYENTCIILMSADNKASFEKATYFFPKPLDCQKMQNHIESFLKNAGEEPLTPVKMLCGENAGSEPIVSAGMLDEENTREELAVSVEMLGEGTY